MSFWYKKYPIVEKKQAMNLIFGKKNHLTYRQNKKLYYEKTSKTMFHSFLLALNPTYYLAKSNTNN